MHDHDDHPASAPHAGPGHNNPAPRPTQWQTPDLPHGPDPLPNRQSEPDFDLVEASFAEAFATASDPTSLLRLAGVSFVGERDGRRLNPRVELDQITDVGAVTPRLGGGSYRYDPLPSRLVSRRRNLRFVYHDGQTLRRLTLAEARLLEPAATAGAPPSGNAAEAGHEEPDLNGA